MAKVPKAPKEPENQDPKITFIVADLGTGMFVRPRAGQHLEKIKEEISRVRPTHIIIGNAVGGQFDTIRHCIHLGSINNVWDAIRGSYATISGAHLAERDMHTLEEIIRSKMEFSFGPKDGEKARENAHGMAEKIARETLPLLQKAGAKPAKSGEGKFAFVSPASKNELLSCSFGRMHPNVVEIIKSHVYGNRKAYEKEFGYGKSMKDFPTFVEDVIDSLGTIGERNSLTIEKDRRPSLNKNRFEKLGLGWYSDAIGHSAVAAAGRPDAKVIVLLNEHALNSGMAGSIGENIRRMTLYPVKKSGIPFQLVDLCEGCTIRGEKLKIEPPEAPWRLK